MSKLLLVIILSVACSSTSSAPLVQTGFACAEGHVCPGDQPCLYVKGIDRHCCGGVACKADFFACGASSECGTDRKCEGGGCVPCLTAGCQEAGDGGTTSGHDLASHWDQNQPAMNIAACKTGRNGWMLGSKMAACLVGSGSPDQSCNDLQGWAPCTANQLSAELCAAVPWGFFGSKSHGRQATQTPDSSMICSWNGGAGGTSTEQRFIFGCGTAAGATTYAITDSPCGGFQRAIPCHGSPFSASSSWDCPYYNNNDTDADRAQANDQRDGELCCRP